MPCARQNWLDMFVVGMSIVDLSFSAVPSWLVSELKNIATKYYNNSTKYNDNS